jgi:hypothetical protein
VRPERPKYGRQIDGWAWSSHAVNCAVVPEPSERTTGTILVSGNERPLLSAVIASSAQVVILPVKILAIVSPESRRFLTIWSPTLSW